MGQLVGSASAVSVGVLDPGAPFPATDSQALPIDAGNGQFVLSTGPAAPLDSSSDNNLYGGTTVPLAATSTSTTSSETQPVETVG